MGRRFGRHKLARRVSPNKSWEGSVASVATSVVVSGAYLLYFIPALGAAQATVWGSTILSPSNWQNLGPVTLTGGSGAFTNIPPYLFYRVSVP